MQFNRCPSREALIAFVMQPDAPRILEHLMGCTACRKTLEELCADEELLADLQRATAGGLNEHIRRRVVALCARIMHEDQRSERGCAHGDC